jgi:hypothetical protein
MRPSKLAKGLPRPWTVGGEGVAMRPSKLAKGLPRPWRGEAARNERVRGGDHPWRLWQPRVSRRLMFARLAVLFLA